MFFQESSVSRTKREIERKERKTGIEISSLLDKSRQKILVSLCVAVFMLCDCAVGYCDV